MNKSLLASAIAAILVYPTAAAALDTKVSGHVNRMIRFADDGERSDVQFIDNTASQSRFRFNTSGDIGGGVTAGIIYEAGLASDVSGSIPLRPDNENDGSFDAALNLRHAAVYFEGNFGRVTLGQTSEAADGIIYADLSGTALVDEFPQWEHGSAINWTIDGTVTDLTLGNTQVAPDGSRRDLIRYDTPSLGGFGNLAFSLANNDRWSIAAYLGGSAGGGEWQLNGGYIDEGGESSGDSSSDEMYGVSASFLFGQGTNITAGYGVEEEDGGDENDRLFVKLGHKWGDNAASISYGTGTVEDVAAGIGDAEVDSFGAGYVHKINGGIELYTGYHFFMGDLEDSEDPEDIHLFVAGTRIAFN